MKFILIIWVCSFLGQNACLPPMEHSTMYDSWYECSRDAHVESIKLLSKMGYAYVNKYEIGTKYNCRSVYTY
jgi:hypothetical protein